MANYFNTINTGLRALQTQKKSLDVTSHNIANANTEGYSRQRAVHATTDPYTVPGYGMPEGAGQIGTGVEVSEISRIKDQFIESQLWEKKQSQGYWDRQYDGLNRIEKTFNEPSENSLTSSMDKFWESLQDLGNNPEDSAVRATVKERANALADTFHSLDGQLSDYKASLNRDVNTTVKDINSLGKRIADLNGQIAHIKGSEKNPNDLMDTRDKLIEELNEKVNVRTKESDRGYINVSIGGMSFVSGEKRNNLITEKDENNPDEEIIKFEELDRKADIKNGELASLLDLRGVDGKGVLPEYMDELDNIAKSFAGHFNEIHQKGYDLNGDFGKEFFISDDGGDITADSIELEGSIVDNPSKIAAGSLSDNQDVLEAEVSDDSNYDEDEEYFVELDKDSNEYTVTDSSENSIASGSIPGDDEINLSDEIGMTFKVNDYGSTVVGKGAGSGGNAINLSKAIKSDKLDFNGDGNADSTVMDKYESIISSLGVDGQRANQMVDNQEKLVNQLENQRESTSGVSLDEEMSNMIKYQQAYNAAAKLIRNSDEMLDSLMSILR
ncbi:MAG: flagellar hook-associated protein FlgK [Halanaerobiales bacterium]